MELEVYNINGNKLDRKVKLDDSIYGIKPNAHAIYLDVKQHLANQRQGTSSSRERSMLSGSRKKIKRQKGTGTARFGDIKNPIFRGGARVFGPHPRDYYFKLNKKLKKLARRSALSSKVQEKKLMILEDFTMEDHKTKSFMDILQKLEMVNEKTLFVVSKKDNNLVLSSRNLKQTKVLNATDLNTYEILNANKLLIVESSLEHIEKITKNRPAIINS